MTGLTRKQSCWPEFYADSTSLNLFLLVFLFSLKELSVNTDQSVVDLSRLSLESKRKRKLGENAWYQEVRAPLLSLVMSLSDLK